jgi:hypothetical protein
MAASGDHPWHFAKGNTVRFGRRWLGALVAALFATSGFVAATAGTAQAAGSPFDPTGSGATKGTIAFYDSAGNQVTSGPLTTAPAWAMATTWTGRTVTGVHTNKGTLFAATPVKGSDPYTWTNTAISVAQTYPTSSAPGALANNSNVLAGSIVTWFDSSGVPASGANTNSDPAWQNLYQFRLLDSGPGIVQDPQTYASATIQVDTGAGTWTQVYPNPSAQPPAVVSPAAVTGTVRVGSTVRCAATFDSTATSTSYQWKRDSTKIKGATRSRYPLVGADYQHKVSCVATAVNTNPGSTSSTSAAKKVGQGPALKTTKAPTITGTAKVGSTLTCTSGKWSPKATAYSYRWNRGGTAIKRATKSKYKVTNKDKGKKLTCTVTAKATGYANGVTTTKAVKPT